MNILLLLVLVVSTTVFACEVTLPHQLVVLGNEGHPGSAIEAQGCADTVVPEVHAVLKELEGRIPTRQLVNMLEARGVSGVKVTPHLIQVQQLRHIVRDQLALPVGVTVSSTSGVDLPSLMSLAPGDRLEVRCSQCLFGARQPINVSVVGFDGTKKDFVAAADFRKMVRAYRLVSTTAAFSDLTDKDLKEEYTDAVPFTDLVTSVETLRFYKTNKPLRAGEFLRLADLNAVNLVRAGLRTDVILENTMVRIRTQGISRGNGAIGDLVEVYHPTKNKKYQGKVVDTNKVLVEL